jgi:hypothetical protein
MKIIKDISQLEEHHTRFIVKRIAELVDQNQLHELMKEVYELDVNLDLFSKMNPWYPERCTLGEEWVSLFFDVRDEVLDSPFTLPVADKLDRLKKLQQLLEQFEKSGDAGGMIKVIEAARLETVPVYRELMKIFKLKINGDANLENLIETLQLN